MVLTLLKPGRGGTLIPRTKVTQVPKARSVMDGLGRLGLKGITGDLYAADRGRKHHDSGSGSSSSSGIPILGPVLGGGRGY